MSRLVEPIEPPMGRLSVSPSTGPTAKDYLERVSKYIPGEILAAYLSGVGVFSSVPQNDPWRMPAYIVFFLACWILTPVYLNYMAEKDKPKRLNLILGTIAFLIWSYAIGGLFVDLKVYHSFIGTIALIIFSLISGLFVPKTGDP
jgi:hypothetical protein